MVSYSSGDFQGFADYERTQDFLLRPVAGYSVFGATALDKYTSAAAAVSAHSSLGYSPLERAIKKDSESNADAIYEAKSDVSNPALKTRMYGDRKSLI